MRNINSPQLAKSFVSKYISSFLLCCSKIRNISYCTSPKGLLCTYFCNGASLGYHKCSSGYYFVRDKHVPLVPDSCIAQGASLFNTNSSITNAHHLKKHSFSTSFGMKIENGVVRFSLDNNNHDGKQIMRKKKIKRSSRSKKSIVDELRFYRLKAKKKMNSPNPEVRIRYKLDKAKRKEVWLIEKLRTYEGPKSPVGTHDPEILTEEERFYLKRTGEKRKNYVPVGRRGVFGGVVLNMHLHWKKHETVKVYFNPCKPDQIYEYAQELTRLSRGIVIDIKPDNSIIFYRGKNYVQPEIMSPPSLSKYKALEKYKLEQSLEHTSLFIEKLDKELSDYLLHRLHFKNKPPPSLVPDHTKHYG